MKVELISNTQNPEQHIENCARTCYKSDPKTEENRGKFLKGLIASGHLSVIEHATASFRISEVSRALTHQLVRHRLFSFSLQSQRYVKEDQPLYFIPESLKQEGLEEAKATYEKFMEEAWATYRKLFDLGLKKEDARYVLPNAALTEICVSGNFREWYNFLSLRCDVHALLEIRLLAKEILRQLYSIAPNIFSSLAEKYL